MNLTISWVKKKTTLQLLDCEFMFWNYYFTQMMTTTMNKPLTLMGRGSVLEGLEQLLVGFLVFFFSFPFFDVILYFFSVPFSSFLFFISSSITFTIQPLSQGLLTFFFFFFFNLNYYYHHPNYYIIIVILTVIITITKFSNLFGYQLPWFQL